MQVTLTEPGGRDGKVLLFGDLAHDTIMKIFTYSEAKKREEQLAWDVLLAPHHCSKHVMYVRENGEDMLKDDVLDAFARHARDGAVIVASSCPSRPADEDGENPPHPRRGPVPQIVDAGNFVCTMQWPSEDQPRPVVFGLDADGRAGSCAARAVELSARAAVEKAASRGRAAGSLAVAAAASAAAGRRRPVHRDRPRTDNGLARSASRTRPSPAGATAAGGHRRFRQ